MKILFLCNKSPYPASEGGPIAMNNLIEGMVDAGHTVKVLAINSNKYAVSPDDIPEDYRKKTLIEHSYVDLSINPIAAFLNLFTKQSFHAKRFFTPTLNQQLKEILSADEYDVVQLETLFMGVYIPCIRQYSKAKIVLRAHNIEHLIWERIKNACTNPLKKLYLGHLSKTLRLFENDTIQKVDGIAAITNKDAEYFNAHTTKPVIGISFGMNLKRFHPNKDKAHFPGVFHLGSMNWMPNEEGIKWFIQEVWPIVNREKPDLKIALAGRAMPEWLLKLNNPNIEVIGEVDNAMDYINSKSICIVPLLSGSGIRIKIIEAMAMAKAVISTSIGAEGINYENDKNILIGDSKEDFAQALIHLSEQPEKCNSIGNAARSLIESDHDTNLLIPKLEEFYKSLSIH